jgi:hypothetical protein
MTPDHEFDDAAQNANALSVDCSTYDSPANAVAEAVASATDQNQMDLEPLQYTVDADALDRLFDGTTPERLSVSFSYEGLQVRVNRQTVEVRQ